MKALSIRIDDQLSRQFDEICQKTGYKKNTLVARLIASFVRHQKRILQGSRGHKDPFAEVIGLMKVDPLLESPDVIDEVVYQS